ncbi:MAG: VWA domain-containing protein [Deltaproteobacteria bacterium]|nr:VWA domain-containing protein [Deltaproteobacteria bacterium]
MIAARVGAVVLAGAVAACGAHRGGSSSSSVERAPAAAAADEGGYTQAQPTTTTTTAPGTLTAGIWDDNMNFDVFSAWFAQRSNLGGLPKLSALEQAEARERMGARSAREKLDIALVVDVTGSMGDELDYLKAELQSIADAVDRDHPDAQTRWALISYQDDGDTYVTRVHDFGDLASAKAALHATPLGGGGDYPESVEDALEATVALGWRDNSNVARMAFWIADAPHHDVEEGRVTSTLRLAARQDVHLYPIAASGADPLTEVTMRAAAQLTGGRYLFLTDDSGVGNAHAEPSIPCYSVTTLGDAMVRMVDVELSGVWQDPAADDVIRTAGHPSAGRCAVDVASN